MKAVSEAKLDLERLSARLMEIQEEERTRLLQVREMSGATRCLTIVIN